MSDETETATRLGRIEGKMDLLIDMHKEDRLRLSSVEKKVWYGSGIAAVAGVFLGKLGFPIH